MRPGYFLLLVATAGLMGSLLAPQWMRAFGTGQLGRGVAWLSLNALLLWLLVVVGRRLIRKD